MSILTKTLILPLDEDDCNPNPCMNNGTCEDGKFAYNCTCALGFTGPNCTISNITYYFPLNLINKIIKNIVFSSPERVKDIVNFSYN